MKKLTKHYKRINIIFAGVSATMLLIVIFFMPGIMKIEKTGNNIFTVFLNETQVGTVGSEDCMEELMRKARLSVARQNEDMLLLETDLRMEGREVLFGKVDSLDTVQDRMEEVFQSSIKETLSRSYTLKINDYTVNLKSCDEVRQLLEASITPFDTENRYDVNLDLNPNRELNVLTASIEETKQEEIPVMATAGVESELYEMLKDVEVPGEKEFSDYDLGLVGLGYENTVEVVEAYLPADQITSLETAIEQVTKEQEKVETYEVQTGDTLSEISIKTDIPVEKLVEMNDSLENADSMIRAGEELIITVPEPELTIIRQEEVYYEEDYDAEVIYIPNDEWYTTDKVTKQEPSAGHRKVVALTTYRNDKETAREIIKEEVVMEAVPKIVEKGTKIPPTYIKPLSGGRSSSGFGRRSAPTRGASTYHKGQDWATPRGTSVVASSSGTVVKAGWGSGYGYVVYIDHGDGRQTRYAHLSKVLVKAGQYVEQGQRIALSGNTGISSGPHVHFEILINGVQVNPMKYLN